MTYRFDEPAPTTPECTTCNRSDCACEPEPVELHTYTVAAIANHPHQHVRARVRVTGPTRDLAVAEGMAALEARLGEKPKFVIATAAEERREDTCERCGHIVTARETGLADVRTARVWCKRCSVFASAR
jgi:hypothetical protein